MLWRNKTFTRVCFQHSLDYYNQALGKNLKGKFPIELMTHCEILKEVVLFDEMSF